MKKILLVSGTSDIAIEFINKYHNVYDIYATYRNKNKFLALNLDKDLNKIILDLSDIDSIGKLPYDQYDPFDSVVLFNAIDNIKPFKFISDDDIIKSFNVNLISSMIILKNLLANRLLNNNSSIIFMNSISGTKVGPKGHSLYSTTKSAINGLMMSLANEYSKKGIRFNSIASGLLKTKNLFKKNSEILSSENLHEYSKLYPLGLGEANDVNELINFLISEKSKWITGQTIVIDGGFSIN